MRIVLGARCASSLKEPRRAPTPALKAALDSGSRKSAGRHGSSTADVAPLCQPAASAPTGSCSTSKGNDYRLVVAVDSKGIVSDQGSALMRTIFRIDVKKEIEHGA
jgi:hypothetical protein